MIKKHTSPAVLSENIQSLLSHSDWYLWNKTAPADLARISGLLAAYVLGDADDCEFTYMSDAGEFQDSLSNLLDQLELEIRCRAMSSCATPGQKVAAALLFFRNCYNGGEFMELTYLEQLRGEYAAADFLAVMIPLMLGLEKKYNSFLESYQPPGGE